MTSDLTRPVRAPLLVQWAGVITWLGAAAILCSLASHTNRGTVVFNRYSLSYAAFLGVLLILVVTSGLAVLMRWQQWPGNVVTRLRPLPRPLVTFSIVAGAAGLAWLLTFGSNWYSFLSQPLMQLGLAGIGGGSALLLYGAVDSSAPANPAAIDRQWIATRVVLACLLVAYLASLVLQSFRVGLTARQYWLLLACAIGAGALLGAGSGVGLRRQLQARWAYARRARGLIASLAIVGYVFWIYGPGLQQALVGYDELLLLSFVYGRSPWVGFLERVPRYAALFRPLFVLQAGILYALFGVNYSADFAVQLALLVVCCVLIFYCAVLIGQNAKVALLVALLFSSHIFVGDQISGWVFDTAPLTGLVAIAVVLVLWRWRGRWYSYLALLFLLLLAPLSRENGLAIPAATMLYVVFAALVKRLPFRQAAALFSVCVAAVILYVALRYINNPGLRINLGAIGQETGFFNTVYSADQVDALLPVQRLGLYLYTALANLLGSFFPVFQPLGTLWANPMGIWLIVPAGMGVLTALIGIDHHLLGQWSNLPLEKRRPILLSLTLIAAGLSIAFLAFTRVIQVASLSDLVALQFAIHSALSLGIAYGATRSLFWSRAHQATAVFAVGLIIATSLVAFAYFRYRTQYLSWFAWLLLLVIVLDNLRDGTWNQHLRTTMIVIATVLVFVNAARIYTSLPLPYLLPANFKYEGWPCTLPIPAEVADAIAARYQLDAAAWRACRAQSLSPGQDVLAAANRTSHN